MAKKLPAPVKRKKRQNRLSLTFNQADLETLEQQAKEAQRPVATYAMILIQRQLALVASPPGTRRAASR